MPSPPTRPGTRKLSEVARKVVAPTGITSSGWPAVVQTCEKRLGIQFDDWQHGAGRLILAKRADGNLAAMIDGVGMSLPRQVGKTYLVGSLTFALCINTPGMLVIWSAHHSKTHDETFLSMQAFAQRSKIAPYVRQVFTGAGDQEIRFHNGSRILFGARERGFGRGIPGVDILVFDEGQILSDKALANMLATMNTSRFGLALYVGTPPRPDDASETFSRMRAEAWAGTLVDGAWIEFGAERGANPEDRKQWARANPSYPRRTPVQSIQRLRKKLKPDDFLREGLGIWDEDNGGSALPFKKWQDLADLDAIRGDDVAFGLDVAEDRSAWFAVAWKRPDGSAHVRLTDLEPFPAFRAVERCKELVARWGGSVVASRAFVEELAREGISTPTFTHSDFIAACGAFADAVTEGQIRHGNQPALNEAVRSAKWRSAGATGERAWLLKDSPEVGPLAAATRALWGINDRGLNPQVHTWPEEAE